MTTSLRRSVGLACLPVLLALVLAHVLLRDRTWAHEWVWALYQYGFVTVLLGPLVAGVAAWEGARLARSCSLLGTADRSLAAVAVGWFGVSVWALVAYSVGLALVVALVVLAGTPGVPPLIALFACLPPVLLLAAEAAGGMAAGWWGRHVLLAPVVAIGCFLLTLWLYVTGPSALVVVGGATGSMAALEPRAALVAWQCAWFAAVTLVCLVAAATVTGHRLRPGRWLLVLATAGAVAVARPLLAQGEETLIPTGTRAEVCVGTAPAVCTLPGYAPRAAEARQVLLPYLAALQRSGVVVPTTFRQDAEPGEQTVGVIGTDLLLGRRTDAEVAVLGAFLRKSCANRIDTLDAFSQLAAWLSSTVDHQRPADPTLPAIVLAPDTPAQRAWVRDTVQTLRDCGR